MWALEILDARPENPKMDAILYIVKEDAFRQGHPNPVHSITLDCPVCQASRRWLPHPAEYSLFL